MQAKKRPKDRMEARLFTEDGFGLEAKVSEDGGAPHLAVWLFEQGKPLKADATQVSATLTRPGVSGKHCRSPPMARD